ncbi:hypothetical protein D3C81_2199610 [compost metagenome]
MVLAGFWHAFDHVLAMAGHIHFHTTGDTQATQPLSIVMDRRKRQLEARIRGCKHTAVD